jgi:ABC-type glycerol-3-phosphate transport system permease component
MAFKDQSPGDKLFEIIILIALLLFTVVIAYPLVWIVVSSFSDQFAVMSGKVTVFPVEPNLRMYKIVFQHPEIGRTYLNTVIYTVAGTTISVLLSMLCAYPLSRRDFFGKGFFTAILLITMFFSGGMIPTFLQVRNLHLINTMWAIVLPGALSVYNTIIMRTFYVSTIPAELEESAFLDGANDLQFFFHMVIPLSRAIMAVMILFYGVVHWNSWFQAFLYISSRKQYPVQLILREIILQGTNQNATTDQDFVGDGIKYATMVVTTLPIMCLYPFLQKYFTKGVMVGSLKG